jgi:hypothetical protein
MESRARRLALILVLLTCAAGAVLAGEDIARRRRPPRAEQFQRLAGGLGFGPALDLSDCAFGLDPRLDGGCAEESGPVPGGTGFCPRHAGSLFEYTPLADQGNGNATPP